MRRISETIEVAFRAVRADDSEYLIREYGKIKKEKSPKGPSGSGKWRIDNSAIKLLRRNVEKVICGRVIWVKVDWESLRERSPCAVGGVGESRCHRRISVGVKAPFSGVFRGCFEEGVLRIFVIEFLKEFGVQFMCRWCREHREKV